MTRCESFVSRPNGAPGSGLSDNVVNCIHIDGSGNAWIGTNAGLDRFDRSKGEWRAFGLKDGLAGDIVCAIQEDASGALWVSTNRGLARYDPERGSGKTFGSRDGLQGGAFNPGASARNADGLMFFGGSNGFNGFDPAGIRKSPFIPPVAWTGLFRNNMEVALPGSFFALRHVKKLRFFYWLRIGGGVGFIVGLLTYLSSFFIGERGDEQALGRTAPATA